LGYLYALEGGADKHGLPAQEVVAQQGVEAVLVEPDAVVGYAIVGLVVGRLVAQPEEVVDEIGRLYLQV
jgi:hypothetical protein